MWRSPSQDSLIPFPIFILFVSTTIIIPLAILTSFSNHFHCPTISPPCTLRHPLYRQSCGEVKPSKLGHGGPILKNSEGIFVPSCLFYFSSFLVVYCIDNRLFAACFLSIWTLPFYPFNKREVHLHIARVKTQLQVAS